MNSPACSAAQNGCTASATCTLANRTIDTPGPSVAGYATPTPASPGASRRRARVDRRYGSRYALTSAPIDAHLTTSAGWSLCELAVRPLLRSPREPKEAFCGHRHGYEPLM